MTSNKPNQTETGTLDQKVKLSIRDWCGVIGAVVVVIGFIFELRTQVVASNEINTRQDRDISNLQIDVRELRASQ